MLPRLAVPHVVGLASEKQKGRTGDRVGWGIRVSSELFPSAHVGSAGPKLGEPTGSSVDGRRANDDSSGSVVELERHRGSLSVLLLLYAEGRASKSRMRQQLEPGQEAIDGAVKCLARLGLVRCESARGFPFSQFIFLTARGRALVETPMHSWTLVFGK